MKKHVKKINFQPHTLCKTDLENPERYFRMFYAIHPIHVVRQNLWDLFRSWLMRAGEFADEDTICSMLQFYELMVEFMEISFLNSKNSK